MVTDVDEDTPLTTDVDTHENKEEYDEMIRHADVSLITSPVSL